MKTENFWVWVEIFDNHLTTTSLELLGKAKELAAVKNEKVVALLIGSDIESYGDKCIACGADEVILVDDKVYSYYDTLSYSHATTELLKEHRPYAVFFPASHNGKDCAARVAAKERLGLVSGCIDIYFNDDQSTLIWERPAFDGKLFSRITSETEPQLGTFGSHVFPKPKEDPEHKGVVTKASVEFPVESLGTKLLRISEEMQAKEEDPLETASIVVSVGKGIQSKENMKIVSELCHVLEASLGVTKPLVDDGWIDISRQIGVTGVKVKPRIYIAIGISGAIQHTLGMKDADLIIAINNDPQAPIFKVAHYGIVGDLFEVVPYLTQRLKDLKAQ